MTPKYRWKLTIGNDVYDVQPVYKDELALNYEKETQEFVMSFNPIHRPLLEGLTGMEKPDFITMWANDIYSFTSLYSYYLYQELRLYSDTRCINRRLLTIDDIRRIFNIPAKGKGSFTSIPHFH